MKKLVFLPALALLCLVSGFKFGSVMQDDTIYQFTMNRIDGTAESLETYRGKVVLIVNVASKCGLTPQYEDLQTTYEEYADQGFVILGFPANNFLGQEPGTNDEIQSFCRANYGVSFPMFEKISVKGNDMHPLYEFLTTKTLNGVEDSKVTWNFQKFLIGRDGRLVKVIEPRSRVTEAENRAAIEALL